MIQQDLFGDSANIQQNPLTDRRVGFIGKFKNRAALVRKVKEFGASPKSNDGLTRDTQAFKDKRNRTGGYFQRTLSGL